MNTTVTIVTYYYCRISNPKTRHKDNLLLYSFPLHYVIFKQTFNALIKCSCAVK